jgi:cellulose synthase/poly-beta-1,6-N-acetylglucosamine synthase-like glycosyltransferase
VILLSIALGGVAGVMLLPTLSDALSVIRIALGIVPPRRAADGATPRLLVLIPAHDEEALLGPCLASVTALQYPAERFDVLVIADNCTDATATVARAAGVRCLERHDTTRRGKPWAIAWALEQITAAEWDSIIVLDADSLVEPDFATALAGVGGLRQVVTQGYIDVSNRSETALTRMAWVWSAIRFRYINGLKNRCGLNVPLGDGVAIGSQALRDAGGWTAFALSETFELYATMTVHGIRCIGVPRAHLYAQEAKALRQSASQRRRWTAGRMQVLLRHGRALLTSPRVGLHQRLDIIAELSALGPAAQLGAAALAAGLAVIARPPGWPWLAVALAIPVCRVALYTTIAVTRGPEPLRSALAFAYLPFYTVWRLAVQIGSLRLLGGGGAWVRTARHRPPSE